MFTAFLAGNGGRVLIPNAVAVSPTADDKHIQFLSSDGSILTVFPKEALVMYTANEKFLLVLDGDERSLAKI